MVVVEIQPKEEIQADELVAGVVVVIVVLVVEVVAVAVAEIAVVVVKRNCTSTLRGNSNRSMLCME